MYSDPDRLRDWIEDIIENIESIQSYVATLDFEAFCQNRLVRDACERCVERIVEAAVRIGAEQLAAIAPDAVLHQLRGVGNRLRHEYDRIDERLIWDVIKRDLVQLKEACEGALANW